MDLSFALSSLIVLIKPVSITMILTALCTSNLTGPSDSSSNAGLKYEDLICSVCVCVCVFSNVFFYK